MFVLILANIGWTNGLLAFKEAMYPSIGEALQKAIALQAQGCITATALALIILCNAYKELIGEEAFNQIMSEEDNV